MATYNGEQFLVEQVKSILDQLDSEDELVIVDDCSTDGTVRAIELINDPRIRLFLNDRNRSHVYSFGKALALSRNGIILMADQDDVWVKGRVSLMVSTLKSQGKCLLSSNSAFMDEHGREIAFPIEGVKAIDSAKHLKNILAIFAGVNNYYGCSMALKREFLKVILPIPSFVESHDLWIAMAGNMMRSNIHLDENTFIRRVHRNNASIIQRPVLHKIWSRVIFVISSLVIFLRLTRRSIDAF